MDIGDKILKTIHEKHILPKSKWKFLLKNYVLWGIGILSFIIGSISFSVVIFMIKNSDWDIYQNITGNLLEFILLILPYFWIVLLILLVFIVQYNLQHTKHGYKYSPSVVVAIIILTSSLFGLLFYNIGLGRAVDDALADNSQVYRKLLNHRQAIWMKTNQGLLSGIVVKIYDNNNFQFEDLGQKTWKILRKKECPICRDIEFGVGDKLRIVGQQIDSDSFEAFMIRKFQGGGRDWIIRDRSLRQLQRQFLDERKNMRMRSN